MSGRRYEIGSGNVFQDIGVPNPEEHVVKAQLVFRIDRIVKQRRLKQIEVRRPVGHPPSRRIPRCCVVNSASSPWSVFCVFSRRSTRTWRSWSSPIAAEATLRHCTSLESLCKSRAAGRSFHYHSGGGSPGAQARNSPLALPVSHHSLLRRRSPRRLRQTNQIRQ